MSPARRDASSSGVRTIQFYMPAVKLNAERPDGSVVVPGEAIATIEGPARGLLTGERTALNFLCHLSGVATATATLVAAAQGTQAQIVCTRKTTPGLRALENTRCAPAAAQPSLRLDDAILIKDNHIALAGDIRTAIARAKAQAATSSRSRSRSTRWRNSNRR